MSALASDSLPVEHAALHVPSLQDVAKVVGHSHSSILNYLVVLFQNILRVGFTGWFK